MSLPLLALRTDRPRAARAPRVRTALIFHPSTRRTAGDVSFVGPSVLMTVVGYDELSLRLKETALRLSDWLAEGISEAADSPANPTPASRVDREWSMTWTQLSPVITDFLGPKAVHDPPAPYTVSELGMPPPDKTGNRVVWIEYSV